MQRMNQSAPAVKMRSVAVTDDFCFCILSGIDVAHAIAGRACMNPDVIIFAVRSKKRLQFPPAPERIFAAPRDMIDAAAGSQELFFIGAFAAVA